MVRMWICRRPQDSCRIGPTISECAEVPQDIENPCPLSGVSLQRTLCRGPIKYLVVLSCLGAGDLGLPLRSNKYLRARGENEHQFAPIRELDSRRPSLGEYFRVRKWLEMGVHEKSFRIGASKVPFQPFLLVQTLFGASR